MEVENRSYRCSQVEREQSNGTFPSWSPSLENIYIYLYKSEARQELGWVEDKD